MAPWASVDCDDFLAKGFFLACDAGRMVLAAPSTPAGESTPPAAAAAKRRCCCCLANSSGLSPTSGAGASSDDANMSLP